jgi:hypothetical protein
MPKPFQGDKKKVPPSWNTVDEKIRQVKNPADRYSNRLQYIKELRGMYNDLGHSPPRWVTPLERMIWRRMRELSPPHPFLPFWLGDGDGPNVMWETWVDLRAKFLDDSPVLDSGMRDSVRAAMQMEAEEQRECDPMELSGSWLKY